VGLEEDMEENEGKGREWVGAKVNGGGGGGGGCAGGGGSKGHVYLLAAVGSCCPSDFGPLKSALLTQN
jgi:hypothetical protein